MNIEKVVSYTLRIGVILSSALVVTGLALYEIEGKVVLYNSSAFNVLKVLEGVAHANPIALMFLGVMILVSTPVLRVFELFLDYVWRKDKTYGVLSFLVLFFMLIGIIVLPVVR